jgi:membrane-associated phospholipid phosphatase
MLQQRTLLCGLVLMVFLLIFSRGLAFDQSIVDAFYTHQTYARNHLALLITNLGSPTIVLALSVVGGVGLLLLRKPRGAFFLILCVIGTSGLNEGAKQVFRHPLVHVSPVLSDLHPPPLVTNPRVAIPSPALPRTVYAYPSGHAAGSLALLVACGVLLNGTDRRWRGLLRTGCAVLALLVGVSRVYLGAHYPSDVLGGWCLAGGWVSLMCLIVLQPKMMRERVLRR